MAILAQAKWCIILIVLSLLNPNRNSGVITSISGPIHHSIPNVTPSNDVYEFSVKAADAATMEILLGKIAALESPKMPIKKLATILSQDFESMNDMLRSITVKCNVTIPEEMSESMVDQVNSCFEQPCDSFDVKYLEIVLRDQQGLLNEFQRASLRLSDPTVRNFARNFIPIIEKNLDSAAAIFGSMQ